MEPLEIYRDKVKHRLIYLSAGFALAMVIFIIGAMVSYNVARQNNRDILLGFSMGAAIGQFLGFAGIMLRQVYCYTSALRSEATLRRQQICETDERERMIRDKTGGFGFNLTLGLVVVASITATFFNSLVATTLTCVLLAMCFVKTGLKIWYRTHY